MNLSEYIAASGLKRYEFAKLIGVSQGYVTMLCQRTVWPGHDLMVRIIRETGGAVTPNDFIKTPPSETPAG